METERSANNLWFDVNFFLNMAIEMIPFRAYVYGVMFSHQGDFRTVTYTFSSCLKKEAKIWSGHFSTISKINDFPKRYYNQKASLKKWKSPKWINAKHCKWFIACTFFAKFHKTVERKHCKKKW